MNEYDKRMDTVEDQLLYMRREYEDLLENISEDQLTFTPIANHGSVPFTLAFDLETKRLYLKMRDGQKYSIIMNVEE
ncbi:MAG: hypothetical protein HFE77_05830 [Clostridiales bacterium]|nr:hypothetical protein [Clostridiales bacterium]